MRHFNWLAAAGVKVADVRTACSVCARRPAGHRL